MDLLLTKVFFGFRVYTDRQSEVPEQRLLQKKKKHRSGNGPPCYCIYLTVHTEKEKLQNLQVIGHQACDWSDSLQRTPGGEGFFSPPDLILLPSQ